MKNFPFGPLTPEIFLIGGLLMLLFERYADEPLATAALIAGTINTIVGAVLLCKRPTR